MLNSPVCKCQSPLAGLVKLSTVAFVFFTAVLKKIKIIIIKCCFRKYISSIYVLNFYCLCLKCEDFFFFDVFEKYL